ncbi:uncharacterized protein G2W53_022209 [Senna tora]|uniref:Uncharacterized protein n=1 Tax=Senna tora TaxID=362788 RepID=A0A834TP86_9FABA|nr:uncharacterized protein G2W53_022209 [Senna tora]
MPSQEKSVRRLGISNFNPKMGAFVLHLFLIAAITCSFVSLFISCLLVISSHSLRFPWLAFLVVMFFLVVLILIATVSRVDLLVSFLLYFPFHPILVLLSSDNPMAHARYSIREESLKSFIDDHLVVNLGEVTYESP